MNKEPIQAKRQTDGWGTMVLIVLGYAAAMSLSLFLLHWQSVRDDQLVEVNANGQTWCGPQLFVHYKKASLSIDSPSGGYYTWYGTISVEPVTSCPQKEAR